MFDTCIESDKSAFDYVVKFLLNQNARSYNADGSCGYRGISTEDLHHVWERLFNEECPIYNWPSIPTLSQDNLYRLSAVVAIAPKSHMCAVGCLIADEDYDSSFENRPVDMPNILQAVAISSPNWQITNSSVDMLKQLQYTHDNLPVEDWAEVFADFIFSEEEKFLTCL